MKTSILIEDNWIDRNEPWNVSIWQLYALLNEMIWIWWFWFDLWNRFIYCVACCEPNENLQKFYNFSDANSGIRKMWKSVMRIYLESIYAIYINNNWITSATINKNPPQAIYRVNGLCSASFISSTNIKRTDYFCGAFFSSSRTAHLWKWMCSALASMLIG